MEYREMLFLLLMALLVMDETAPAQQRAAGSWDQQSRTGDFHILNQIQLSNKT